MSIKLDTIQLNDNPIDYVADDNLLKAVQIAVALNRPLLVSGEPGTGKTKLADYVAKQLSLQTSDQPFSFLERPLVFNTKSTSIANDLFYFYDAVNHFRSQQSNTTTEQFIELRPMGLAIAQTYGIGDPRLQGISGIRNFNEGYLKPQPSSSVLLIDEIDKAPREFPNDLLNEIENYEFEIKELNQKISRARNQCRILIIMTSNSEKNLPNAFLRRCIFYHIAFPDKEKLFNIAKTKLLINDSVYDSSIVKAIEEFNVIRSKAINKKPSTSEFLDWIHLLQHYKLLKESTFTNGADDAALYESTKSTLVKNHEDQQAISNKSST